MLQKSYMAKSSDVERKCFLIDAQDKVLGRVAAKAATILRGKHKPIFSPSVDCGDYVIVLNADKISVTGQRLDQKVYYRHSGYPGGLREITLRDQLERHPTRAVEIAVKGMLPKNKLGRKMFKKLKIYAGSTHPHGAQQPIELEF